MGEHDMAAEVFQMHNRLEAFSDGLDKDVFDCAIKAAEEAIKQRDELKTLLEHDVSSVLMNCSNEIITLREKLRVAEEAFEQAKIELIETGTCAETLDEALAKIREVK
jgi:hypothetical protein